MKLKAIAIGIVIFISMANISFADDNPPSIKNVKWSPTSPNTHSIIRISATVTDADGVAWVRLFYCFEGSCFPPVEMSGSNDKYSCQIGPFEEGTLEFHVSAQDTVGNVADSPEYSVYVDGTPPSIRVTYPNGGEMLSGELDIEWDTTDNHDAYPDIEIRYSNDSGGSWHLIANLPDYEKNDYRWNSSSFPDGSYLIKIIATDDAGNYDSDTSNDEFSIDNTPPFTTINLNGTKNGEWFTSNVSVTISAQDNLSGVAISKYRIDNGAWKNYTSPFLVTENGIHIIHYYSIDVAGNKEKIKNISFKIDKNVPSIEIIKPRAGHVYFMNKEVMSVPFKMAIIIGSISVQVNASDEFSGLERVEFYINGNLKYVDTESPYEWEWSEKAFGFNTIVIVAYNNAGNYVSGELKVFAVIT